MEDLLVEPTNKTISPPPSFPSWTGTIKQVLDYKCECFTLIVLKNKDRSRV